MSTGQVTEGDTCNNLFEADWTLATNIRSPLHRADNMSWYSCNCFTRCACNVKQTTLKHGQVGIWPSSQQDAAPTEAGSKHIELSLDHIWTKCIGSAWDAGLDRPIRYARSPYDMVHFIRYARSPYDMVQ